MISVVGNKKIKISKDEFVDKAGNYKGMEIDLGTGDGRYVYKNAIKNPGVLFVGVDPSEKQMEIYSKKAVKDRLGNVLYIVGSIENFPKELFGYTSNLHIILPWGTLLENVIRPENLLVNTCKEILKEGGLLEIVFGYVPELEPSETKRLDLKEISEDFIMLNIIPEFERKGFIFEGLSVLSNIDVGNIESTWAKKLKFGRDRKIFRVLLTKIK